MLRAFTTYDGRLLVTDVHNDRLEAIIEDAMREGVSFDHLTPEEVTIELCEFETEGDYIIIGETRQLTCV